MKTFFITAQLGQEIRDFLVGDFRRLAKDHPDLRLVVFVSPEKFEKCRYLSHEQCIIETLPDLKQQQRKLKLFFRVASWAVIPTETAYIRHRYVLLRGGSLFSFIVKRLIWVLGHTRFGRASMRWIEWNVFRDEGVWKEYFEKYKPDVVFAPGGYRDVDFTMVKYAKRHGIPSVGMLRSWDNMSSKGFLRVHPDLLLVQNPIMLEEAVHWNDFPRERTRLVGSPSFDRYIDPAWFMSKDEVAKAIGADPKKRWLIYCDGPLFSGILFCEDKGEHIDMLQKAIDRGELKNLQIIARLHPANRSGLDKRNVNCIVLNMIKDWGYTEEALKLLYNIMRWGDVATNFGSTIALDSCIADRPVVLIGFNGYNDHEFPWDKKLSVAFDHTTHMEYLLRTGGVWLVSSEKEFIDAVKTYLEHPEFHKEGRRRIVEEVAGPIDGRAAERVLESLLGMMDRSKELLPTTGIIHTYRKLKERNYNYGKRRRDPSAFNVGEGRVIGE